MTEAATVRVTVVWATSEAAQVVAVVVAGGSTVRTALEASGLSDILGFDVTAGPVGIFGRVCGLDEVVSEGDRIEIYRPLAMDPKLARQRRAQHLRRRAA